MRSFWLLVFLASSLTGAANTRVWHDTAGRTFTAQFLWTDGETLHLKSTKGKEFQLPLAALANADLEFVRNRVFKQRASGIHYTALLTWEEYRSKNFTAQEAARAGYFPLDSRAADATLRLEFRRFGKAPILTDDQQVVLRLTTGQDRRSGTSSHVYALSSGKVAGSAPYAPSNRSFDIPLSPAVLKGGNKIVLEVRCGSDPVHIRTLKSGAGARLLIIEKKKDGSFGKRGPNQRP